MYVLLSKIGPCKVFFADISNTAPQRQIESEVSCQHFYLLKWFPYWMLFTVKMVWGTLTFLYFWHRPVCFKVVFLLQVINAYLTLLVRKFNKENADRAFAVDTFEMTSIWERKKTKIKVLNNSFSLSCPNKLSTIYYQCLICCFIILQIDPGMYKYIVGVVNESQHWMLVVILNFSTWWSWVKSSACHIYAYCIWSLHYTNLPVQDDVNFIVILH